MTGGNENTRQVDDLAEVSASYRAARRETTPADLDRMILRAAAEGAGKPRPEEWLSSWSRPLAFAATLVLCIALLLEVSDQQLLGITGNTPVMQPERPDPVASHEAPLREERNAVKRAPSRPAVVESAPATTNADEDFGDSSPGQNESDTTKSASSGEQSPSFRDAADVAARQVQAVEASANTALTQMPADDISPTPGNPASAAPASGATPADASCSVAERARPSDWWRCINDLREAGFNSEAEIELRNLRSTFPRFVTEQ